MTNPNIPAKLPNVDALSSLEITTETTIADTLTLISKVGRAFFEEIKYNPQFKFIVNHFGEFTPDQVKDFKEAVKTYLEHALGNYLLFNGAIEDTKNDMKIVANPSKWTMTIISSKIKDGGEYTLRP